MNRNAYSLGEFLTSFFLENKIVNMKIVVRAPNWIGDSVLALPCLESLQHNFAQAEIWIAARKWVKDVFAGHDLVTGIIQLPEKVDINSLISTAKELQQANFDLGLLLTNSFSSALLFYLARIPRRWGYHTDGRRFLLTKGIPAPDKRPPYHQLYYYLNLLDGLGLEILPPKLKFPLSAEEKQRAKELLGQLQIDCHTPLIIIHPGAAYGSAKRWPPTRYAQLTLLFQQRQKASILITGSEADNQVAEAICSLVSPKPLNLSGKTDLRLLAALISQADLFISNDSGPMHIANALQVPVVAIFGPTIPQQTGPFQPPSVIIKKEVPCWPCLYRECPFDHRCLTTVSAEEVYQASLNFLS